MMLTSEIATIESRLREKSDGWLRTFNDYVALAQGVETSRREQGTQQGDELDLYLMGVVERLFEVEAAIERIRDGEFGTCRACGATIDSHLLQAIPEAPFCERCASEIKRQQGRGDH